MAELNVERDPVELLADEFIRRKLVAPRLACHPLGDSADRRPHGQHATAGLTCLLSLPSQYVRLYGEARLENPFVAALTDEGMKYLRSNK